MDYHWCQYSGNAGFKHPWNSCSSNEHSQVIMEILCMCTTLLSFSSYRNKTRNIRDKQNLWSLCCVCTCYGCQAECPLATIIMVHRLVVHRWVSGWRLQVQLPKQSIFPPVKNLSFSKGYVLGYRFVDFTKLLCLGRLYGSCIVTTRRTSAHQQLY